MLPCQLLTQEPTRKVSIDTVESFHMRTSSFDIHVTHKKIPYDQ